MMYAVILAALHALLVHAYAPHYQYYSSGAKWWFSNYLWPLPPELVQANNSPAGTVSATIGHSLPYTLRVNVSELAVTNAIDDNKKKIDNAHIVATTFDVTYTGSNALNSTQAFIEGNSSIATQIWVVAYNYEFPQSVLDNYDPSTPGDCSKPLGAACVRALEQHDLEGFTLSGLRLSVPECADTLGGLSKDIEDNDLEGAPITPLVNNVWVNATDTPVWWLASAAFSGRDQAALDDELSKLQLVGITTDEENTSSGATNNVTSVMCFRVGGKAVQGAATTMQPGMRTCVGAALLTGLAVAWVLL